MGSPQDPRGAHRLTWSAPSSSGLAASREARQPGLKKKMKTPAERRSAPSLILDRALQKLPSTKESPSASVDTCIFLSSFMCSNRILLIDGRVELKRGLQRQERYLFLFNDLFVVTKIKCYNNFKVKNKIKLNDMWTASCVDEVEEGNTNALKSFILGWPTVNFVATFSSPEQKDKWLSLLQRYINLEKEKDYPKSIPLKIFTKDIGNCAYYKTITIMNSDTANEVINMSLSILGITGSERDYQLWVNSGKEETPYPLIGHEYPYGIKMSHLRDTSLLTQLSKVSSSPSNLQEPFLMDQLPREMQCQFILKPSRLAAAQQLSDSGQKTSKRRRSIINWAFWRSSSIHLDNLPMSPTSPLPGQLFGVSLPNICENDNLPQPILDMLSFLNQKGPLTEGIFRLSANVKSCRELKEKLDSGVEVHLDCESIFVIASVLKDFLRNIPGSIFSSDLYDQWVCVMDQGNDEEKINTTQRLLDQLPRANVVLLRYLFGVLHNIEQHSSSNQMNAYNLAVCIAPSILWPPTSSSLELENEYTKKVSLLIQFMIENCCRIFGEEITSLLGEVSVKYDTRGKVSDLSCFQMNDSTYDSLEKELNENIDAPCSDLVKKLSEGSRSMDSLLTPSDYDLDQPEAGGLLTLNDLHQPEAGGLLTLNDVDQPEKEGLLTLNDLDQTEAGGLLTLNDLHQPEAGGLLTLNDLHQPEAGGLLTLNDLHQPEAGGLLTLNDLDQPEAGGLLILNDLDQPEAGGLLTLNDFDLDGSKHKDIKMEPPLDSQPGTVAPQDPTRVPSGTSMPHDLSMAAAEAPKSPRQHHRCSEPSINYRDSKLSYLREFYRKKLRKSSCDAILPQKDEDHLKQNQLVQKEGKTHFKQSLVTGTESKKNATNKNVKKKSLSTSEGNHVKLFPKSKPVDISVASCSHMSSHDHPRNHPLGLDTSGYSPPHKADAVKSSKRYRRCSEPSVSDRHCTLSYLRGLFSKKQHTASCEAGHLHGEEDYLKRHKSLQMDGQKLINQSLVLGIEVGKSSATNHNTEKILPSTLNICPRTSYSSLSSPDTSPSGSSASSQDRAFSQISEHSVFTPTKMSSPIDCTFQAQIKQKELSSDFCSTSFISGMPGPSSGQASSHLAYTKKDTTIKWYSQMHSVTLHPSTWLRNGMASLKNWSLKKKTRASEPEEKKAGSLKGLAEPPPHASGVPEANSLQEKQEDMPPRAAERLGAVQTAQWYSSYPSQDSEKDNSSPLSLAEDGLKLCTKSQEEGENSGQCSPGTLPCVRSSLSSLTMDDVSSPDSGSTVVCDGGDKHSTKDI